MLKTFISCTTLILIHQSTSNLIILIIGSYFLRHKMATPPGILPRTILVLKSVVDSPVPWKSLCTELSLSRSCLGKNFSCRHRMSVVSSSWSTTTRCALSPALCPRRKPHELYDTTLTTITVASTGHHVPQHPLQAHSSLTLAPL